MSFIARLIASTRDTWTGHPDEQPSGGFGGPIGALVERIARHLPHWHHGGEAEHGGGDPRRRIAFTIAVIALGAKMAKADGVVTRDEVAAFREVFQIPPGEEEHVRLVFDLARRSTAGFESYARQVGHMFAADRAVLEDLLGGLFHIALADRLLCAAEDRYLREVAHHFGFTEAEYARIRALHAGAENSEGDDPYAVLGVVPGASADEVRSAYHRLVRETHPDLVIAQGLPPECVALANTRVARINAAYARLAKHPAPAAG